ncbi:hypothetical protein NONI108955_44615 [Nocardia ninae]
MPVGAPGYLSPDLLEMIEYPPQLGVGFIRMTPVGLVHLRQLTRQRRIDPRRRVSRVRLRNNITRIGLTCQIATDLLEMVQHPL